MLFCINVKFRGLDSDYEDSYFELMVSTQNLVPTLKVVPIFMIFVSHMLIDYSKGIEGSRDYRLTMMVGSEHL